jgi:hypothetical protein
MKLKPGSFYVSRDGFVWCCFKANANARTHEHNAAYCVRIIDNRIEYFFSDGRYDLKGLREHTLVKKASVAQVSERPKKSVASHVTITDTPKTKITDKPKPKFKASTGLGRKTNTGLGRKLTPESGLRNAKYFGAECQANPGSTFSEYKDDIAVYYGFNFWDEMPKSIKDEAIQAFNEGKQQEKKLQNG